MRNTIMFFIHWLWFASPTAGAVSDVKFQHEVVTDQDDVIWGFDFISADRMIFSERGGKLRVLDIKSKTIRDLQGAPEVFSEGQGGMLDVRVHPTQKSKIYFTYSAPAPGGATTTLASATVEGDKLTRMKTLFSAHAPTGQPQHFGSRIEFDGRGHVFVSTGDRQERGRVQDLKYHNGKIIRLNEDGSVPGDNPFAKKKGARSEIWSYGHRNPQGLFRNTATGDLWSTEMGPKGGDELNLIKPGANYGWPVVTHGLEYTGEKIGDSAKSGMEAAVAFWVPSISPSGATIYTGKAFPQWVGDVFIGNLGSTHLRRVKLDGQRVVEQEELLKDQGWRIRNVRTGPDGFLYLSTDDGKIVRLKNTAAN